jgi:cellulose synthase/poly-beta-1,6-N-acetylglucosamine synthase-like glycosyltransferase
MIAWLVFGGALFWIGYVIVLYPLLLGWRARVAPHCVAAKPAKTSVSVMIAVHNGQQYLAEKLDSVLAVNYPRELLQILVVSDGSNDATEQIARDYAARGVELVAIPRGGKCAALNAGAQRATGDILLLTDVRQQIAPASVQLLVDCFSDPSVGVVSGQLVIRDGSTNAAADIGLYWRLESWIRRQLSAVDSMFGASGSFYAIRRSLYVNLPLDILLDDMYLPLSAFRRGYRLVLEPRALAFDFPTSLETEFRRKVRTLAGNYQILLRYPWLLGPENRMWIHFISYKFGRLLLPPALLAIAISSFFLPPRWAGIALAAQGAAYGLALIDPLLPKRFPLKRLSSPARTFAAMMIATVCGLQVFFVPARQLWKVTGASAPGRIH